jgi:hypothetical protein
MSEVISEKSLFERLIWPERTLVSDLDRKLATTRVTHARTTGEINEEQAQQRLSQISLARTRADLHNALTGISSARSSESALSAHRVAVVLWLGLSALQFVVWFMICLISGSWSDPWWLWTAVIGAAAVGGLWWLGEQEHKAEVGSPRKTEARS